jgi:hypothetical protein
MNVPIHRVRAVLFLFVAAVACVVAGREFVAMWQPDVFHPSNALTRTGRLSDYCASLRGSRADAAVYVYDSGVPGATMLVLGGTHPNEPAGFMAATILVENARMTAGRLIVIPQACADGFTSTDPLEGVPGHFAVPTAHGNRTFRFGSRAANVVDQWPDPLVYLQYPSGQQLSGNETRNLNRAYPGRPDGTTTEQTAFAIMQLLEDEQVTLAVDLHEAAPEIPIINALITHEKGRDIAADAVLNLEIDGLQYALELSPPNFRGLSHREWGDRTKAIPFLMETSNPIQGRLRGRTSGELILKGEDSLYLKAARLGAIRITYDDGGEPLARRVGRHLQGLHAIIRAFCGQHPESPFTLAGVPDYAGVLACGVGAYLR